MIQSVIQSVMHVKQVENKCKCKVCVHLLP